MNYIGLVALILGLVSIFITFKYVDNYDKLSYQLSKVGNNITFKYPQELLDIQDELNLSDNDFKKIIVNRRKEIISIMKRVTKKETFVNFNIYLSSYQRRIPSKELSDLFKNAKKDIDSNSFDYKDEFNLAKKSIMKQDNNSFIKNIGYNYDNLNSIDNNITSSSDKSICLIQYGGQTFGRYINNNFECDGIINNKLICNN